MYKIKVLLILTLLISVSSCKTFYITEKTTFTVPQKNNYLLTSGIENELHYAVEMVKTNDSTRIEVWTIQPSNPENLVFFFPANGNNLFFFKDFLEKVSVKTNAKIIGVHYRGYGKSSGKPSFETSFADNDFIFSREMPYFKNYRNVTVMGISIGTLFSGKLTSLHPQEIDNLILLSTFSSPKKMLSEGKRIHVPFYAKPFIKIKAQPKLNELNNVEYLRQYYNKLLIVQAKDDRETGYKMGEELYDKVPSTSKKLYFIEKGGHFAPISKEYTETVVEEIVKMMKQ